MAVLVTMLFCVTVCLVVPACITPARRISRDVYLWAYLAVLAASVGAVSAFVTEKTALWIMLVLPGVMVAAFRLIFFPGEQQQA